MEMTKMEKSDQLTKKQLEVYDYILSFAKENGYPPTVREICKAMDIPSTSTTFAILNKLEAHGYLIKDPKHPRALKILKREDEFFENRNIVEFQSSKAVEVPVIGRIAAGAPLLAVENIEDYFPVPSSFVQDKDVFLLRISGDSMIDAGILNNDYVLIARQKTAKNRDIVAALINDEATVKTYYKEKNYVRLQPENEFYEPIIFKEGLTILGKVIGVFRKL
jgi:repressor LexA